MFTFSAGVSAALSQTGIGGFVLGTGVSPLPPPLDALTIPPPIVQLLDQSARDVCRSRPVVRVLEVPRGKQSAADTQSETHALPQPPLGPVDGKGAAAEEPPLSSLPTERATVAMPASGWTALAAAAIPSAVASQTAASLLLVEVTPEAAQPQRPPPSLGPPTVEEGETPLQLQPSAAHAAAAVVDGPKASKDGAREPLVSKKPESQVQVAAPAALPRPLASPSGSLVAASNEHPATSGIVTARTQFSSGLAGSSMAHSAASAAPPSGKLTGPLLMIAADVSSCEVPCARTPAAVVLQEASKPQVWAVTSTAVRLVQEKPRVPSYLLPKQPTARLQAVRTVRWWRQGPLQRPLLMPCRRKWLRCLLGVP